MHQEQSNTDILTSVLMCLTTAVIIKIDMTISIMSYSMTQVLTFFIAWTYTINSIQIQEDLQSTRTLVVYW